MTLKKQSIRKNQIITVKGEPVSKEIFLDFTPLFTSSD